MLGFLVGAVIFGLTYQMVFPIISAIANYGSTTIPVIWNLNPALTVLFFTLVSLFLFYLIDRKEMHRKSQ
jgi:hypothetical protein